MAISVCSLSFHTMALDKVDVFGTGVQQGIIGNPTTFTSPPFTNDQYGVFVQNYVTTRGAYKMGGKAQKPAFLEAKTALMGAMDTTADYVNGIAKGNADIITLAGFKPTHQGTGGGSNPPVQAQTITVDRSLPSGQIGAECESYTKAESFGCILSEGQLLTSAVSITPSGQLKLPTGTATVYFSLSRQRKKLFTGLTSNLTYYVYFYVVNAAGVSPLSEGKSVVCP